MSEEDLEFAAYDEWEALEESPECSPLPPDADDPPWGVYIAEPVSASAVGRELARLGISDPMIEDFIVHFDQLRESPPRLSGGFRPASGWRTIEDEAAQDGDLSWYGPDLAEREVWAGSVIVFSARNGDELLLAPSGKLGWMMHAEGRIEKRWGSFEGFIGEYEDFLEYRCPFDSYGPADEAVEARRKRS